MGIINVTPDSFSGDGILQHEDIIQAATAQAELFLRQGADILDIGGESTRPGAAPIDAQQEQARVIPVIPLELKIRPLPSGVQSESISPVGW
ncbi:MAG: dihydropteroate synthase [Phycisphaerales bacterium]